jgi:2-desacetyl-2-hydroxyethyl bacteriochlorophyllide A dehydrogenase
MSARLRRVLYFVGEGRVEVREENMPHPGPGEALVRVLQSGISAGTELLAYRGELPRGLSRDLALPGLAGSFEYPFTYGYASVGIVEKLGPNLSDAPPQIQAGSRVFAFQPHASHYVAAASELIVLDASISDDQAIFLPNMETAVTLVLDAAPLLGERVAIWGQGIVGRLTASLLCRFPLAELVVLDLRRDRLERMAQAGVRTRWLDDDEEVDLAVEVSGSPLALQEAINRTALEGRVVVGSWFGKKPVTLDLGSRFHRQRLRLISSQVSTLPGHLSPAWDRHRRWNLAAASLATLEVEGWISHRFACGRADEAFACLDRGDGSVEQVVLRYE